MASIKEMDQNSWVCYRFGDNSYYYGEVGLLDESGIVHSKDNAQLATDPKVKLVKHGFGIYIYDDPQGSCRYEGYWDKDKKSGTGKLTMKDGSCYQGQFREGCYHDVGKLTWGSGDCYDGRWKKGRMDGPGIFKRKDGSSLKGSFKNNYLIDGNVLRNPFLPDTEYEKLKKARKDLIKQYEKNEKIKSGFFERVNAEDTNKLLELVERSVKNNRVPLCVASEQTCISLKNLCQQIVQGGKECKIVDLRKSFVSNPEQRYNYVQEVTGMVQESMRSGKILVISLDDSEEVQEFEELFYPEIKDMYTPEGLNQQIWAPKDLHKAEIREKIIGKDQINENFRVMVWSKVKYPQSITDDFLREKLQKRFESVIPFIKIDMILAQKMQEEKEDKKEEA